MLNIKKAEGTTGYLLKTFSDGKFDSFVFRVYEKDKDGNIVRDEDGFNKFKDYEIRHYDLIVKLLDGYLYEEEEKDEYFIDYSPKITKKGEL